LETASLTCHKVCLPDSDHTSTVARADLDELLMY
jgi:hypothetical protein